MNDDNRTEEMNLKWSIQYRARWKDFAEVAIVLAIGLGMVLLILAAIVSVIHSEAERREKSAACWSEYGNSLVTEIPARCRFYMGFTE